MRTFLDAWAPRSRPELNQVEETQLGPRIWDGEQPGLHRVWDAILLRVGEQIQLGQADPRPARRGELDIRLSFELSGHPPDALVEALRTRAYEILALLNLRLGDFVTPAMPFQIRETLPNNETELTLPFKIEVVEHRHTLDEERLGGFLKDVAHFHSDPRYGDKYRIALELYAAHFTEQQARVRFILLVIAMEALAEKSPKHQVALDLLARWKKELQTEKAKYQKSSEEFYSLQALSSELDFRGGDSIGNQIRKLFSALPGVSDDERAELQRRAVAVYQKRSTLVHEGYVPVEELPELEREARTLLEKLLEAAIERSKPEDDRFGIEVGDPQGPRSNGENA
ncbi:hypothetical protein BST14_08125 [Mycobacterium arosiense ATCC BAA-1401 = DSM 45069]|uniref:Uncharacterized protein n=1 Tax=Mycobacterium arosiense ATCC BAA-1401 = DSM 45069 TaxID=1265311 RepID=A0A1W9ZLV1_MYCAI|nr:hypothetical protein BST14_08125 [Mycobacterium arosiense ATCC BAA-1401 = DSM 45069]